MITSPSQLRSWVLQHLDQITSFFAARDFARSERARVDAYIQPIWDSFKFDQPTPDRSYLVEGREDDIQAFFEATYRAHAQHGWTGGREQCPALVAEHKYILARQKMIEDFIGAEVYLMEHIKRGEEILERAYRAAANENAAVRAALQTGATR